MKRSTQSIIAQSFVRIFSEAKQSVRDEDVSAFHVSVRFDCESRLFVSRIKASLTTDTSLVSIQDCTIIIERISYDSNQKVGNLSINYANNGINDAVINVSFEVFVTILNMKVYLRVRLPEDENDRTFKRDLMKTTIDVGKLFSGNAGNFVIKGILENLLKSYDFEPKFPFQPVNIVSCSIICFLTTLFVSQRTYKVTNFTLSDRFIPVLKTTDSLIDVRVVGKTATQKNSVFLLHIEIIQKITR